MSLARDVTTVGSATLVSRLLGFFRDVGIAAVLGTGAFADAFFAVLQLTNVFRRLLAEGALNAAFVPVWLRIKAAHGEGGADRFFQEVLVAMLLAAGALTLIGLLFAPAVVHVLAPGFDGERSALAADYLRIAAPYVVFAGVVAVVASVLNAERRVVAAALGLVAFNAVLVSAVAWIAVFGRRADAGQRRDARTGDRARRHRAARGDRRGLPARARHTDAPTLRVLGRDTALLCARGPQPDRRRHPATQADRRRHGGLVLAGRGVVAVLRQPALRIAARGRVDRRGCGADADASPRPCAARSRARSRRRSRAPSRSVSGLRFRPPPPSRCWRSRSPPACSSAAPSMPRDTAAVAAALAAICAGLPGHVLEKVLGAVSFAHEDTRTPMLAALAGLATALAGALVLFPRYGHVGVAAAIAISGWVGATLLGAILLARGWLGVDRAAARRLPRIMLATAVMGAALVGAQMLLAVDARRRVDPGDASPR